MSSLFAMQNIRNKAADLEALLVKYKAELLVFFAVFVIVFSSMKMYSVAMSSGNVEQWANLTNQVFYEGKDFLFSYGPLYWLVGGSSSLYNTEAYWLAIVFVSLVNAAFWSLIFTLVHRGRAYIFLAVAYFLFFSTITFSPAFYLLPFALVAYFECAKDNPMIVGRRGMLALGAVVGFLFYVRFFYGLVGVATFGSYFFVRLFSERKISRLMCFVVAVATAYVTVGLVIFHDASSVVNYLIINKNLSFGNSVDMTLDVVNSQESLITALVVIGLLNVYLLFKRRALLLTVNVLLLLLFKLGFSRTDHYLGYFVIPTAALALVMVFDRNLIGRVLFAATMVCLYYMATTPSYPGAPTKDSLQPATDFRAEYTDRMQGLYADFKLDDQLLKKIGKASIDIYPYNNEYAFANKLNYRYRPSFQNYMTLTPALDLMNKAFFESSARPEFILWTAGIACISKDCNVFDAFDRKYSLNEDPQTVNAILQNYHVVSSSLGKGGVPLILMAANDVKAASEDVPLSESKMKFGEWQKVPKFSRGVVKAVPDFELTMYARLKNLLFRGSILTIRYKLVSGDVREYRLNILNSKSGVWITPLLDNFGFSGDAVDSVMYISDSDRYFKPEFNVKWVGTPLSIVHNKPLAISSVSASVPGVLKSSVGSCEGSIDLMNGAAPASIVLGGSDLLKIQGWLIHSTQKGTLFDKTYLTLTDEKGKRIFILTSGEQRPDIGVAFKNPALNAGGFNGLLELSSLKGTYKLGMGGLRGSEFVSCSQFDVPVTVGS